MGEKGFSGRFPFLGNGNSLDTPSPATVLLLFKGLIKSPVSGNFVRRLSKVLLDSSDHPTQNLHIGNIMLILHMGKDQAIIILGEGGYLQARYDMEVAKEKLHDKIVKEVRPFSRAA